VDAAYLIFSLQIRFGHMRDTLIEMRSQMRNASHFAQGSEVF
jgi:hypothetical protein